MLNFRPALALTLVALTACGSEGGDETTASTGTSGGATPASTSDAPTGEPTSTTATTGPGTDGTTTDPTTGPGDPTTSGDPDTTATTDDPGESSSSGGPVVPTEHFSFFVTSFRAMQELSGSQDGFGGDLRFGEEGPGAGLRGADKICATIADMSMPNASLKGWRAFLSANQDENGQPVDAIDRVGPGPWYDRLGRLVASSPAELASERPADADPAIIDDLPNEEGVPNHQPDPNMEPVDNHDTLTGSNKQGRLGDPDATCEDWTTSEGNGQKRPTIGHSWPRGPDNGRHWISDHDAGGCAPGANIHSMGGPQPGDFSVGAGGGYGGIYCFALMP